jgi:hypothetical protein
MDSLARATHSGPAFGGAVDGQFILENHADESYEIATWAAVSLFGPRK